ncbi:MAG: phosphate acyltransferase [Balneolaceae bacterium]
MALLDKIRNRAAKMKGKVIFPEAALDIRVLKAVNRILNTGIASPILIGDETMIYSLAERHELSLPENIQIVSPLSPDWMEEKIRFFTEKLSHKNLSDQQITDIAKDPLHTAGWLLLNKRADAAVAGSIASTADVIRAALRTVGVTEGSSLVSSTFLMEMPDDRVFSYADCGVVPYPEFDQLADIAIDAGYTHRLLTGEEPIIAFLSFSTYGSARHERVELVTKALKSAKAKKPGWKIDGELQFDAALLPEVAERKAPDSTVAGKANVFIFPNLDAANIAYKITERLAGATATGPILQGLSKPFMDLSRGCSVDDIINAACVGLLMSDLDHK